MLLFRIAFLSLFSVFLLFSACGADPCNKVECGSFGDCSAGRCICQPGYQRDATSLCNLEKRAKFLGDWSIEENCDSTGEASYSLQIVADGDITQIGVGDFNGRFINPVIAIPNINEIEIIAQAPDENDIWIEGRGIISANIINWNFKLTDLSQAPDTLIHECTAIWTKN